MLRNIASDPALIFSNIDNYCDLLTDVLVLFSPTLILLLTAAKIIVQNINLLPLLKMPTYFSMNYSLYLLKRMLSSNMTPNCFPKFLSYTSFFPSPIHLFILHVFEKDFPLLKVHVHNLTYVFLHLANE